MEELTNVEDLHGTWISVLTHSDNANMKAKENLKIPLGICICCNVWKDFSFYTSCEKKKKITHGHFDLYREIQ